MVENQIEVFNDPDIVQLKSELKELERQFYELTNEKEEYEKLFFDFHHRHTIELGDIILEILKLRKLKFKSDKIKYEDAESDERQYKEQVESEKNKHQYDLTDEEKIELKKNFRRATLLCHPDKVSDICKDAAQKTFIELKLAYEANNLNKVSEILSQLEKGNYFKTKSETIREKDKLIVEILKVKNQIESLQIELSEIKESETYKALIKISNYDEYFKEAKQRLIMELEALKTEI
jgi:hypothetical protein